MRVENLINSLGSLDLDSSTLSLHAVLQKQNLNKNLNLFLE
jgi:hypothetical protein